jgi:multiple sugar transport system substrate-binding protein
MKRTVTTVIGGVTLMALLAGCGGAASSSSDSGGDDGKLVVWNWGGNTADSAESYQPAVLEAFEKMHPDIEVEVVSQPFDNYYTLLGTAIQSNSGPDVVLFNGGTQMKSRTDALVPLDEYISDEDRERLVGWEAFTADDVAYAVPTTLQGFPLYYNKAVFEEAGVSDFPPATWEDLDAACEAVIASGGDATCFALGNKEQLGIEFFLSGFGPGIFTPDEYQAWIDGERDWESEHVRQVFEMWKQTYDDGWYNEGVQSTAMFNDEFDIFNAGNAGAVVGLASGTANYAVFDEYLGDDLGVFLPPVVNPEVGETYLPIEGGIGYGVTKWSTNPEAAADLAIAYADHDALALLGSESGSVTPDVTIVPETDIEAGTEIISWLPDGQPLLHTALGGETLELLHLVATEVLTGDTSIDDALAQLAASEAE